MRFFLIFLVFTAACGDDTPPEILQASLPAAVTDGTGPFVITAVVTDNYGIYKVHLLTTPDLNIASYEHLMHEVAEEYYQISIGPFSPGSRQYLAIQAADADGNRAWYPHPEISGETGCVVSENLCWHEFSVLE
jgi:hypothetical protein